MRRAAWHALDDFFHCWPAVLISYGLCFALSVYVAVSGLIQGYGTADVVKGLILGPLLFAAWCALIAVKGVEEDCGPTTRFIDSPPAPATLNLEKAI